ncbi:MAG: hypothetical protein WBA64_14875, partial [Marinomonas sp.]|uniref:hypothetical protein n=1 Tax=Marinomonas sp. TaxID=1904862 RepID=UPI003C739CC8
LTTGCVLQPSSKPEQEESSGRHRPLTSTANRTIADAIEKALSYSPDYYLVSITCFYSVSFNIRAMIMFR